MLQRFGHDRVLEEGASQRVRRELARGLDPEEPYARS